MLCVCFSGVEPLQQESAGRIEAVDQPQDAGRGNDAPASLRRGGPDRQGPRCDKTRPESVAEVRKTGLPELFSHATRHTRTRPLRKIPFSPITSAAEHLAALLVRP